jgi:hypothetical protein
MAKISNRVNALSYYGLPLIELADKRLEDRVNKGILTRELKAALLDWKEDRGLRDPDELEYKYFLQGIGALNERTISDEDLLIPLFDNITLSDVVDKLGHNVKIYYLSRHGMQLSDFLITQKHHLYEIALFWLLIRSKNFNPLIQKLFSDHRCYEREITDDMIPGHDGISRALVRKWLTYFGLIRQNRIDRSKLATMLLYASTLEMNERLQNGQWREYVGNICRYLSTCFSISEGAVDFSVFLEYLFFHLDRAAMMGYPSGREHQGLSSRPSVQMLEINGPIPLSCLEKVQPSDTSKAIVFRGV